MNKKLASEQHNGEMPTTGKASDGTDRNIDFICANSDI